MPRVIFICPYLKGNGRTAAQRRHYVKYIATREGVELMDDSKRLLPATWRQKKLIGDILKDFPDTAQRFEYEDYLETPTRENASAFIAAALEQNLPFIDKRENYIDYIARRPRAERAGAHGLFNGRDEPIVLDQVAKAAAEHPGNLWTPIISLRREDAARLGYDNAANWRAFLTSYAADLARGLKIQPERFHWYAAYHDEGHHPHVHMVCWSDDAREGFLTKDGIRDIKSGLAARLFRQELLHVYEQQTVYRELLSEETQREMESLIARMERGTLRSEAIEYDMARLVEKLRAHKGKKQYGYLSAPVKELVDRIVDELAKDGRVADAYAKWCDMRLEVLQTYLKEPPHPGPLSQQKELKRIRNIVVEEAAKLAAGAFIFEETEQAGEPFPDQHDGSLLPDDFESELPETDAGDGAEPDAPAPEDAAPHVAWSDEYRRAKACLFGSEETPRDFDMAMRLFTSEALAGNALAMYDLARMHADGLGVDPDPAAAHEWYAKALAAFSAVEDEKANRYVEYRIGKMHAAGLGTDQDHGAAADWFRESADQGYKYAQYSLAGLYAQGKGVDQDNAAAFGLYTKAAAQVFPYASFELGKMFRDGVGTQKDQAESVSHFQTAYRGFISLERQSHDDKLQYRLGWMLENGVGTEKDIPAAMAFYEKAAGVGNPHAQYALARLILADEHAASERAREAVALLEKAADAGNGSAVYALAKLYRDGSGSGAVEKNIVRAVELFERAAVEYQSDHAAYQLGKLYLNGEDIPKDTREAIRWLEQASDQGNQYAQYALAVVYLSDGEIPKDVARALPLLAQSAGAGNEHALYRLGRLYLAGEDVPKDTERAVRYLTEAAERGNQYAQYTLVKLYLMGGEIPRDRERARHWLEQSAAQGNEYARFFLDHFDNFRDPSLFMAATRLMHHMGRVFRDNPPVQEKGSGSDSKVRRREREKKIALGHAPDDHELSQNMN